MLAVLLFLNIFNIRVQVNPTDPSKILFVLLQSELKKRETHGTGREIRDGSVTHIADDYKLHQRRLIVNHVRN